MAVIECPRCRGLYTDGEAHACPGSPPGDLSRHPAVAVTALGAAAVLGVVYVISPGAAGQAIGLVGAIVAVAAGVFLAVRAVGR